MPLHRRGFGALACAAMLVLRSRASAAQPAAQLVPQPVTQPVTQPGARPPRPTDYPVTVSEGRLIRLPSAAHSVILADPSVADVQTPTTTTLFLFGKKPGRTSLFVLDDAGNTVLNLRVVVNYSDEELRSLLRAEIGDYPITMAYTPTGAVLSGTVPTPLIAEKARAAAARFLGDGRALVNNLQVIGNIQVELRVRVAEVARTVTKQLGVNWSAVGQLGNVGIGLLTGRSVLGAAGAVVQAPGGAGSLFASYASGRTNITGVIDALETEGLLKVLAEPNLVAVSGETATFNSGGQFPVPIGQGLGQVAVEYRTFGVGLSFTPTVLSNDLIGIKVTPEVSELSTDGAVTENNFSIPALRVRRADTTIELGSGQSFAIAGLIQDNFNTTLQRYPGLASIPVLGLLFRSASFQRNETELVIIVTPYIVRPVARPTDVRTPSDLVSAPSDFEQFVLGRLSGIPAPRSGARRLQGDYGFLLE